MVTGHEGTVLIQQTHEKTCAFCGKDLQVVEGVMIYDRNWYHNGCWSSFEKLNEVERFD